MVLPWWATLGLSILVLSLVAELGFRVARRVRPETAERKRHHVTMVVSALLGLLALLLGFTFTIAEDRLSIRKRLVLDEANAIGTTYLRARMLPPPHTDRVRALLRQYVNVRLAAHSPDELDRAIARSEELHDDLWAEAVAVEELEPYAMSTVLFTDALNELIDLHESRVTVGLHHRIPRPMRIVLLVASVLGLTLLGYGAGLIPVRSPLATLAVVAATATMITLILELDRPTGSVIAVSETALTDVQETIERAARRAPRTSSTP